MSPIFLMLNLAFLGVIALGVYGLLRNRRARALERADVAGHIPGPVCHGHVRADGSAQFVLDAPRGEYVTLEVCVAWHENDTVRPLWTGTKRVKGRGMSKRVRLTPDDHMPPPGPGPHGVTIAWTWRLDTADHTAKGTLHPPIAQAVSGDTAEAWRTAAKTAAHGCPRCDTGVCLPRAGVWACRTCGAQTLDGAASADHAARFGLDLHALAGAHDADGAACRLCGTAMHDVGIIAHPHGDTRAAAVCPGCGAVSFAGDAA